MFGSPPSFRQWSAEVQPFVIRQFDCLLHYLREMDSPARLIVLLTVPIFCYLALQGFGPKCAY